MSSNEPMSDERLAGIRQNIRDAWDLPGGFAVLYGAAEEVVRSDLPDLLAEVERRPAREAAWVEIVRAVADGWSNALGTRIGKSPDEGLALREQARALLASAGESEQEGGGDGA